VDFQTANLLDGYMASIIVWDIETVPDLKSFAVANGHDGRGEDEIRAAIGDKFPKHIYHSIICIGALIGHRDSGSGLSTRLALHMSGNALKRR
jgi:hypothetical protein